ncbi:hypothetical protein C9J44_01055 [Photobacterium sp. GB-27]|uniref:hypothetical protein n=1 Tax=unclassified Photobacterium TaxID=2628852 RepID=UPI000D1604D5|nr:MULTISPECIES: hypothetical protein [unclassified Photobacterium]PSV39404.1 hypothetical protein C9J44_01055 [Photobacterium sp. GB-27]PSV46493.1 hypothetical protein C9J46_03940 [Photobacterium sp. GB-36]PSV58133.1 hypothetical protein C9J43_05700 [Photobacterium sp. GB-3]
MKLVYIYLFLFSAASFSKDTIKKTFNFKENRSDIIEECFKAHTNDVLHFEFNSLEDIDFNIHWHKNDDIYFLEKISSIKTNLNNFTIPEDDSYCIMFKKRGETDNEILLQYYIEPYKA